MMLITQQAPDAEAAGLPRRRWRALRWMLASTLVFLAAAVLVLWWINRPPASVSVNDVINRFRSASPSSAAAVVGGPRTGVYLYATRGSERISAGHVTHHYPAITTLTVATDSCGLRFRWDALAGRYGEWQLCRTGSTWSLDHYTDVHTFLYMKDVHDYTCSGFPVVACRSDSGVLTLRIDGVGPDRVIVAGSFRTATHLHVTQSATGKSVSSGTIDLWILPSGLPARVEVDNHGAQTVLGSRVTYQEQASFALTSVVPRR